MKLVLLGFPFDTLLYFTLKLEAKLIYILKKGNKYKWVYCKFMFS